VTLFSHSDTEHSKQYVRDCIIIFDNLIYGLNGLNIWDIILIYERNWNGNISMIINMDYPNMNWSIS